mmetsp:Transcript_8960/g.13556  ORF Transcript_8960/g.13556 Transcript_8960/m.13556 type:complete len:232 (+) Transcript_8960:533-1228(+)
MMSGSTLASKDFRSLLKKEDEESKLIGRLSKNISPHWQIDQGRVTLVGSSEKKTCRRWLCSKCKSSHCVHNEIHPQHHDRIQRWLIPSNSRQEGNRQSNHIHSQLKLQELANVIKHGPPPKNSLDNARKLIIHDNNITRMLGNVRPTNPHGQTNIRGLECRSIIRSISRHTNDFTHTISSHGIGPFLMVSWKKQIFFSVPIPSRMNFKPFLFGFWHESSIQSLDENVFVFW